jgi:hypothetical protein
VKFASFEEFCEYWASVGFDVKRKVQPLKCLLEMLGMQAIALVGLMVTLPLGKNVRAHIEN